MWWWWVVLLFGPVRGLESPYSYVASRSRDDAFRSAKRLVLGDSLENLQAFRRRTAEPVVLTGASSGIGSEIARMMDVIACGREDFDLGDLEATAAAADRLKGAKTLILNAGVWPTVLEYTIDELELGFQVNHLAQFLLYLKLQPERVVVLSSVAHALGDLNTVTEDVNWNQRRFDSSKSYARTKLMNVLFVRELARRGKDAVAVHPGLIPATRLFRDFDLSAALADAIPDPLGILPAEDPLGGGVLPSLPFGGATLPSSSSLPAAKSPEQAARDVVYAALDKSIPSGTYLSDGEPTPTILSDAAAADRAASDLWAFSEDLLRERGLLDS